MEALCLIVPCYNEEQVLPVTAPLFREKLSELIADGRIAEESRILFVDDGSTDSTWRIICELAEGDSIFEGIALSRNRGHQNALLAGLTDAADHFDITVSIDCDGQDDIDAIDRMLEERKAGAEVVYGVRSERNSDSRLKRCTAQAYYRFLSRMGADVVYNHADYRLLSSRALRELLRYEEVNLYLRGMVPLVGFQSSTVEYVRQERIAGKTHYSLRKMFDLALNGLTGLTVRPMRLILIVGLVLLMGGSAGTIATIVLKAFGLLHDSVWILLAVLVFLSGLHLSATGLLGEYAGKTFLETKRRPRFVISKRTGQVGKER